MSTPAVAAASSADKEEITDLKEQVAFLLAKRTDDKQKMKELEKVRLQFHQVGLITAFVFAMGPITFIPGKLGFWSVLSFLLM